jgi:hypothetical protein
MSDVREQLAELRKWREDGTLKAALARQRLGAHLSEVESLLHSGEPDIARLDVLKSLSNQHDLVRLADSALVIREATRIRTCGTDLQGAATPAALAAWQRHRWKDVRDAGTALETAFRKAWSRLCTSTFTESERLARILAGLEPTKVLGEQMLEAASAGLKLRDTYPPGIREREEFARAREACTRCRQGISGIAGTTGLAELLLRAADGNATLADVSPELRQWLEDNKVLRAFRLRLA